MSNILRHPFITLKKAQVYTAKNTTDLLQVVDKKRQTCQFHQVATNLLKSGLLQLMSFADLLQLVETTCSKPVYNKF